MHWLVTTTFAAECGPTGCPAPPQADPFESPVKVTGLPPLDLAPPAHVEIATFALG